MNDHIMTEFDEHISVIEKLRGSMCGIQDAAKLICNCLNNGGTVFICGNGGSAADSQHFAAELTGRFRRERASLSAIALTTDTSAITSIANDYSFAEVFSRQLSGLASRGDVLLGISTSGNSKNVLNAVSWARHNGVHTISLTGKKLAPIHKLCDHNILIESENTARIQEAHILVIHLICELVEHQMGNIENA